MAFRKPKQQPQFADLKGILAQTKETENPLYQTLAILIDRLTQFQGVTLEVIGSLLSDKNATKKFATRFATFHTKEDETAVLPNSVQLLAGSGITFDDTVPNKRTINSTGGGGLGNHYDAPLSDGDLSAADLIYAAGECIIVQVPV